jgi:AcrR family transcriptional regulator
MERQPSTEDHETRQQILKAAEELFIAKGFKGVSMSALAEAVHVTNAALYYYFQGGKQELFADVIRQVLQEGMERVFQMPQTPADFRQRLTLLTENFLLAVPVDRLSLLMRDAHEYIGVAKHHLWRDIGIRFNQRMMEVFQEAIDAGEIGQEIPAEVLVWLHQGMCAALLNRKRFFPGPSISEQRLAQMVVSVLLDGVHNQTQSQT